LLRERAAAGNYSDRLRRLSIHSTCPHPTPSVHLWAGQHIQPHAHNQVEPTTRPVENSAAHIPKAALHALAVISAKSIEVRAGRSAGSTPAASSSDNSLLGPQSDASTA
jgi:hypothetical protein